MLSLFGDQRTPYDRVMGTVRQATRAARDDQRGFTLVETLVAAAVGGFVLAAVGALAVTSGNVMTVNTERVSANQRARTGMERVTQQLRTMSCDGTTPPIVEALNDRITFYGSVAPEVLGGPQPLQRRTLEFVPTSGPGIGNIVETLYTDLTGAAVARKTLVAERVARVDPVTPGSPPPPIFEYFAFRSTTPVVPTLRLFAPVPTLDRGKIVMVHVNFVAEGGTAAARQRTQLTHRVFIRTADPQNPAKATPC